MAVLGFWTSSYLREREAREATLRERMQTGETNARLYSELTSKREESESALRKDMFTSIINSFLGGGPANLEQKVLNLELLVYNFHESLNLKPLFLHIARLVRDSPQRAEYLARLNRVAEEVDKKQMLVIEEGGATFDATLDGHSLSFVAPDGESQVPFVAKELVVDGIRRNFKLEVLGADRANEQVQLRVTVRTAECGSETISTEFWLGHFDFPMIDNTRLPHDQRLAVVLNNFDAASRDRRRHPGVFPRQSTRGCARSRTTTRCSRSSSRPTRTSRRRSRARHRNADGGESPHPAWQAAEKWMRVSCPGLSAAGVRFANGGRSLCYRGPPAQLLRKAENNSLLSWARRAPANTSSLLDDAPASPSSRFLASDPTALVTPSHTLFQQPATARRGRRRAFRRDRRRRSSCS